MLDLAKYGFKGYAVDNDEAIVRRKTFGRNAIARFREKLGQMHAAAPTIGHAA